MVIIMGVSGHSSMSKIMGASTINKNINLVVFDVPNRLQILGCRKV